MRLIPLNYSLGVYLADLQYTDAALAANPETADLVATTGEAIASFDAIAKAERDARHAVDRADAVVTVCDQTLDEWTTQAGVIVFAAAGGDRSSPFFRRFFLVAPSSFVRFGLRKQCQQTLDALVPEMKKLDPSHPLAALAPSLEQASKAGLDALDKRGKAMSARGMVANDVREWKDGINRMRTRLHLELQRRAVEKGRGKDWADAFFRRGPSSESSDADLAESEELSGETSPAASR